MFTHRVLCYSVFGLEAEFNDSGDLVQGYLFGANTYSTNPILTYKKSGSNLTYHYYHNDHLFTPQRLTDSTGVLSWSADYSAFGETTVTKEEIINHLRFPGQYYDADIKLAQNYFRDYSAELGRYVETDPIGLDGGINFYGYGEQNPIHYYDNEGKFITGFVTATVFFCAVNVIGKALSSGKCGSFYDYAKTCIVGGITGALIFSITGGGGVIADISAFGAGSVLRTSVGGSTSISGALGSFLSSVASFFAS